MTQNTEQGDLADRVRALEAQVGNQARVSSLVPHNFRDHLDADMTKAADGQVGVYSAATGRYKPVLVAPPFSLPGAVSVAVSGRWYPPASVLVRRLFVSLRVAGSSSTTVRLLRNGAVVTGGTVTLAAAALTGEVAISQVFAAADFMQVETTVAGAAASDLVVQVS